MGCVPSEVICRRTPLGNGWTKILIGEALWDCWRDSSLLCRLKLITCRGLWISLRATWKGCIGPQSYWFPTSDLHSQLHLLLSPTSDLVLLFWHDMMPLFFKILWTGIEIGNLWGTESHCHPSMDLGGLHYNKTLFRIEVFRIFAIWILLLPALGKKRSTSENLGELFASLGCTLLILTIDQEQLEGKGWSFI